MHLARLYRHKALVLFALLATVENADAAPPEIISPSEAATADATRVTKQIKLLKGVQANLWAAEPLLENPVAFAFDEKGRMFVAEGFRIHTAVLDARGREKWPSEEFRKTVSKERAAQFEDELLNAELAAKTVADREQLVRTYFQGDLERFTKDSDIVKRVVDVNGDGVADQATLYAGGFNRPMEGLMSGILARRGHVWITNIPSVWRLGDKDDDGVSDAREEMSNGYGVRYALMGHDMHGLRLGPDGRMYFSIGDRGASVKTREGKVLSIPDRGGVFRCELDGSRLELFAEGLRNPQELAFDQFGNLFTGDNNSDGGDKARFVYVVEGGDSGWRTGFQYIDEPVARGPWNSEKMWHPPFKGQPAYLVPPIDNITSGPSGLTYHPGSGQLQNFRDHFFLVDFRGQPSSSGVHSFRLQPQGVSFKLVAPQQFAWGVLATDVDFGPDGALYISDWVLGWSGTGKGRIHRLTDAKAAAPATGESVQSLLAGNWSSRSADALLALLAHDDVRVRMEAQFQLVQSGRDDLLLQAAQGGKPLLMQLHGIWGLGQILRQAPGAKTRPTTKAQDIQAALVARLQGKAGQEDEARVQAARVLGDSPAQGTAKPLTSALSDRSERVRFYAAQSLARLRVTEPATNEALVAMLAQNADRDPFLRHAGVMALVAGSTPQTLAAMAKHQSPSVRLAAVVALRRQASPLIATFLQDKDPAVVREAARAINDAQIDDAMGALADLAQATTLPKDEAILARVVHANFRQGTKQAAQVLAKVAAERTAPPNVRQEAITALGDWATPQPRDRVTGNYRAYLKQNPRDAQAAPAALASVLDKLLMPRQPAVFISAATTAAKLQLVQAGPLLAQAVAKRWDNEEVRMAALRALSELNAPELMKVLPLAARDSSARVRLWGLRARVKAEPAAAVRLIDETLRRGAVEEKQAAIGLLATVKDPLAVDRLSGLLDDLLANKLPKPLVLDVLEAAKEKADGRLETKLAAYDRARPQTDLGPYQEAAAGGDAELGRKVFMYHQQVQCRRCHSVEGHGAQAGPELNGVARRHPPEYLLEAVVYPSKHFARGFESVLVTMKDGAIHGGTVKKETPTLLLLDSVEEGTVSLTKKEIADREPGASGMPDGFGAILNKRELRDLIAYLSSLK